MSEIIDEDQAFADLITTIIDRRQRVARKVAGR